MLQFFYVKTMPLTLQTDVERAAIRYPCPGRRGGLYWESREL